MLDNCVCVCVCVCVVYVCVCIYLSQITEKPIFPFLTLSILEGGTMCPPVIKKIIYLEPIVLMTSNQA